jgi:hypothetical protein
VEQEVKNYEDRRHTTEEPKPKPRYYHNILLHSTALYCTASSRGMICVCSIVVNSGVSRKISQFETGTHSTLAESRAETAGTAAPSASAQAPAEAGAATATPAPATAAPNSPTADLVAKVNDDLSKKGFEAFHPNANQ